MQLTLAQASTEIQLDPEAAGAIAAIAGVIGIVALVVAVLTIAGMWKTFAKAGKPGWAAIVPIYNLVVLTEITGRPTWWVALFLVPIANIVVAAILFIDTARSFGKDTAFGVGLWLLGPVFWPILGFGESRYHGPAAAPAVAGQQASWG